MGRRAQIRFSQGARGEKPENDRPPFWFYGESIRTSVHGSHMLLWKRHHRNAIVRISFFLRGAIAVEARRRRAASARIIYYTVGFVEFRMDYVQYYSMLILIAKLFMRCKVLFILQ